MKKTRFIRGAIAAVAAGALLCASTVTLTGCNSNRDVSTAEGVAYLEALEAQDVDAINTVLRDSNREMRAQGLTDDEAMWLLFEDSAVMGDSRALGFSFYKYVNSDHVFAKGGDYITDIPNFIDQVSAMHPDVIYLCYGLNDIGIRWWPDVNDYAAEVDKQVQALMAACPNSTIVISSILPAVGAGLDRDDQFKRIDEYNAAVSAMASEKGYNYANCSDMAYANADLYNDDGLHVSSTFYPLWAEILLDAAGVM